jgi:transketolase
MAKAIEQAKAETSKPSIIRLRTTIGYGSRDQGTHGVHGNPLKADDTVEIKKKFGFNPEEFFVVPDETKKVYGDVAKKGAEAQEKWNKLFSEYESKYPEEAKDIKRRIEGKLPEGWEKALPSFTPTDDAVASRKLSEVLLAKLSTVIPELVSGSADLTPSNLVRPFLPGSVLPTFSALLTRLCHLYRPDGRTLSTSNLRRLVSVTTLDDTS